MTPEHFLMLRTNEMLYKAEAGLADRAHSCLMDRITGLAETQFAVIALSKQWPIQVIEDWPKVEQITGFDTVRFKATQRVSWVTREEYVKRFGTEPPASPLIRQMLERYKDHPDFQEEWLS